MNVDMLKSKHVINVSDDELEEAERLNKSAMDSIGFRKEEISNQNVPASLIDSEFLKWLRYVNSLAEVYLPEKLTCRFERIEVKNIKKFKEGLTDYLWNTDLSWYLPDDDFWNPTSDWCLFSEVILTRKIENEPID